MEKSLPNSIALASGYDIRNMACAGSAEKTRKKDKSHKQ